MFTYAHVKLFLWPIRARVLFELFYQFYCSILSETFTALVQKHTVFAVFHRGCVSALVHPILVKITHFVKKNLNMYDLNVTYLFKICSRWRKQAVKFFLQNITRVLKYFRQLPKETSPNKSIKFENSWVLHAFYLPKEEQSLNLKTDKKSQGVIHAWILHWSSPQWGFSEPIRTNE